MAAKQVPPAEYLHQCFAYNGETGGLTWKTRPREHFRTELGWRIFNGRFSGSPAMALAGRFYLRVRISIIGSRSNRYLIHRIVWMMIYGEHPDREIDHINGDGRDNRVENLRLATHSQNMGNSRDRRPGRRGSTFDKAYGKWAAQITVNRKMINLGRFDTEEAAHAAYCEAAKKHFGEFARLANPVAVRFPSINHPAGANQWE